MQGKEASEQHIRELCGEMINGEFCWEKTNQLLCVAEHEMSTEICAFFILSKKNTLAVNGRKFFRKFLLFGMPFIFLSLVFLNDSMGQHTKHAGRSSDMSFRSSAPIAFLSPPWHIPVLKAGLQPGASFPASAFLSLLLLLCL